MREHDVNEVVYDCITQIQCPDICPTILFLIKWTLSIWDKTKDSAAQGKHLLSVNLISNSGSARRFIRGLPNRCSVKRRQARGDREVRVTHKGRSAKKYWLFIYYLFIFSNSSPCAWIALRARLALVSVRLNVACSYVGLTSAVRGARAHFLNIGSPLTTTAWILLPNLADVQCFFFYASFSRAFCCRDFQGWVDGHDGSYRRTCINSTIYLTVWPQVTTAFMIYSFVRFHESFLGIELFERSFNIGSSIQKNTRW